MDQLFGSFRISASGMQAQSERLRVISENLANADSLGTSPGDAPYRRKTISFRAELERSTGLTLVRTGRVREDPSAFAKRWQPSHPAADADGYVLAPNVKSLIEMADMREAQRSYEANLNMIRTTKNMVRDTVDILR